MTLLHLLLPMACHPEVDVGAPDPAESLPVLQVRTPERGSFTSAAPVSVSGTAAAGSAPLDQLSLNGQALPVQEGEFSRDYSPVTGLNVLGLRLTDTGGGRAVDGRAFIAGERYDPGATIRDAVRMELGPGLLDDDDPDLDDVAALAQAILEDPSTASAAASTPMETDYFVLYPTSLSLGASDVDIAPDRGVLHLDTTIHDVWMDFDIQGVGWYDWVSTSGSMWASSLDLSIDLAVGYGSELEVSVSRSSATLDGYGITVDWFPDSLEGDLADWTRDYVQSAIADQAASEIEALVADTLQGLAVQSSLGDVDLSLALSGAGVDTDGVRLVMDASASTRGGIDLPDGAGSTRRDPRAPDWPITAGAPFAVAVSGDLVNQLLFATWWSGLLSGISMSGSEMELLAGSPLQPPLGPSDTVGIDLGLPPVVGPPAQPDMQADLGLGELRIAFHREDGQTLDFSVNVLAGLTLGLDGDAMRLELDRRPSAITLEVGVLDWDPAVDPGDLAALVRLMVPPLLAQAPSFAPGYELPRVDIGAVTGSDALDGVVLGLSDGSIEITEPGWVVLRGGLADQR